MLIIVSIHYRNSYGARLSEGHLCPDEYHVHTITKYVLERPYEYPYLNLQSYDTFQRLVTSPTSVCVDVSY